MRFRQFALAAFVLLLGLAACRKVEPENTEDPVNNEPTQTEEESTPVTFTATGLNFSTAAAATVGTRATVDGNWYGVSSVGVMIDGTVKEYTVEADATDNYEKATLNSTDPHYWSTTHDPLTVTAWWPYNTGDTSMPNVVVNENQSTADGFEGSDFISAENQEVTYSSPTLSFTHRTARLIIKLEPGDGVDSYQLAYATVSLTGLSEEDGNPPTITPYNSGSNTYEALLAPQTITTGTTFIQVKLDEETFSLSPEDDLVLDANYRYTYTIKVDATGLELVGSRIGDWESGGSDESGTAEELNYTYDSGTKTYTVYSAEGLLAWNTAAQTDLELNCTLAADIDMTGKDWTLVGKDSGESNRYTGTFDGGGHTITGLTINQSGADDVGLIGCLGSGGVVQNLTMYNVSITGYRYVGGVVGSSYAGTVTACSVSGSVSGSSYVGSVVGYNYYSGTVTACYAWGSVTSTNSNVGGVVGRNYGTVTACYAWGSVSSDAYVGGVVGYNLNAGTVTACYWDCDADCDGGENGLGGGSGETTKVDGSTTWQDAVSSMNDAIDEWNGTYSDKQCNWKYEYIDESTLPTLKEMTSE